MRKEIDAFNFRDGEIIANKYEIIGFLGSGWEGEVYKIMERSTKIERAAKFFYPQRNTKNKVAIRYARKLHELSSCPIIIHYHTHEFVEFNGVTITCLISEYVDGVLLTDFLKRQPGKRLGITRGLQLLHALVSGLEAMHNLDTYHGDLHSENIIVKRYGLGFDLKLLDMYHWGRASRQNLADDIVDSIKIFYDAIGGKKYYIKHPPEVKQICMGMQRKRIVDKFRSAADLRNYLENIDWQSSYREKW